MIKTLVIAPHADDELLGCGGTLLLRGARNGKLGWVLLTSPELTDSNTLSLRQSQLRAVRDGLGVLPEDFYQLDIAASHLDQVPLKQLVSSLGEVITKFEPNEILAPFPGDAHSDHSVAFKAASAVSKWFRYPSVRRLIAYETLSETNFGVDPRFSSFRPNSYVDVSQHIEKKIQLLSIYESAISAHPFPRSIEAIKSLAVLRGSECGCAFAEAFMIIREFEAC